MKKKRGRPKTKNLTIEEALKLIADTDNTIGNDELKMYGQTAAYLSYWVFYSANNDDVQRFRRYINIINSKKWYVERV